MDKKITSQAKILAPINVQAVKVKTETNTGGTIKLLVLISIFVIQITALVFLYIWLINIFLWYLIVSFVLSFGSCVYTLSSNRNGQSKAVWILFYLLLFPVGFILCFLSDEKVYFRKVKQKYKKIFQTSKKHKVKNSSNCHFEIDDFRIGQDIEYLKNSGDFSAYKNTKLEYFSSGTLFFDDVLSKIKLAQEFIFIEFFIISEGILLERILKILEEKAKLGVDIRIVFDDMGSHGTLKKKTKKRIKDTGIKLYDFNRLIPVLSPAVNYRDHRKIIIVDGKCAYTGGANLADEYINEKRMYGYWKDSAIRLDGEAVDGFTFMFLRQWEFLSGKSEDYSKFLQKYSMHHSQSVVIPYADGIEYSSLIGRDMYANIISKANKKIYIMTPYLVLDEMLENIIINKARSGVDIRIILPGVADKSFVYNVTLSNAEKFAKNGVKIYLFNDSFVHSKVVLTDYSSIIGSINMDMRSFYQQFESALYTNDINVLNAVECDFDTSFIECTEFIFEHKKPNLFSRIFTAILKIISPLM